MIRTLKIYLTKDLVKATFLTTLVLTVVLAVLGVIEPLRERGLSGPQALKLFTYSLPLMFSLTMPVAALFAATLVYGRFSQDNELMAGRASGICTLSLLRPAVWLGAIVSVATLCLALWVAPQVFWAAQRTVKSDLEQAAYHRLKTQQYLKLPDFIIHADRVDPKNKWIEGVVVVDRSNSDDARVVVTSSAFPKFEVRGDEAFVIFQSTNPTVMQQSGQLELNVREQLRLQRGRLPNLLEDKPKFYTWGKLRQTWSQPNDSAVIREGMTGIQREICAQRFYRDLIDTVTGSGRYDRLVEYDPPQEGAGAIRLEIRAAFAAMRDVTEVVLTGGVPAGEGATTMPVTVDEYQADVLKKHFLARSARVRAGWDDFEEAVVVTLTLEGARGPGLADDAEALHQEYAMGPFAVPADVMADAEEINLDDLVEVDVGELLKDPTRFNTSAGVARLVARLRQETLPKLLRRVAAEMHCRIAYGVCCMLMVVIGAAMGLILRGGQVMAAMAVSAIPASLVIMVLIMGRQMISNPDVPAWQGIVSIWGGVVLMSLAAAYLYAVRMRR